MTTKGIIFNNNEKDTIVSVREKVLFLNAVAPPHGFTEDELAGYKEILKDITNDLNLVIRYLDK